MRKQLDELCADSVHVAVSFGAGFVMIAVSGAVLVVRLWRMTRTPLPVTSGVIQSAGD
jgi:tellurite resistance protein TehA-like permease